VLRRLGATEVVRVEGCCGLAGNFGFEREHYQTSLAVADLSLTPMLATDAARDVVLADGFSCQSQIDHVAPASSAPPLHLAQLVDDALVAAVAARTPTQEPA
jgi:Fe-S oxidoreductase